MHDWSVCGKLPVERLRTGDVVCAVESGPRGRVIDHARRGWTLVAYASESTMAYQHGKERLYLVEAIRCPVR